MPRSEQDIVPAFPLHLVRIYILAEVMHFIFQRPFAFRVPQRDISSVVTMSVLCMARVSSGGFNVGEISHAPVPASLPLDRL